MSKDDDEERERRRLLLARPLRGRERIVEPPKPMTRSSGFASSAPTEADAAAKPAAENETVEE